MYWSVYDGFTAGVVIIHGEYDITRKTTIARQMRLGLSGKEGTLLEQLGNHLHGTFVLDQYIGVKPSKFLCLYNGFIENGS